METVACPSCNTRVPPNARYCNNCGALLSAGKATETTSQQSGHTGTGHGPTVHPSEPLLFALLLIISAIIYVALIVSVAGIFLLIGAVIFYLIGNGIALGYIRGNAVRVSNRQFPEVQLIAISLCEQMQLTPMPPIYVLQQGGALNAFAMRLLLGQKVVVIYSDVFEVAYREGEEELAFILAHELAHIRRGHTTWIWVLTPALSIPFIGHAYSRATEFTADRYAAYFRPGGADKGLLILAAGKWLYSRVDGEEFGLQTLTESGFWVWLAEALSTHPRLPRRIQMLKSLTRS